jgi:predicted DNA binding CopG/RHH family protein
LGCDFPENHVSQPEIHGSLSEDKTMTGRTDLPPVITEFLDAEEEELYKAIESGDDGPWKSILTPERKAELMQAARNTLDDERIQISLRISKRNLSKLKARALREGMPYQTLINSILHKAVN